MYILSQPFIIFRKQSHRMSCFPHASRWCTPMNPPPCSEDLHPQTKFSIKWYFYFWIGFCMAILMGLRYTNLYIHTKSPLYHAIIVLSHWFFQFHLLRVSQTPPRPLSITLRCTHRRPTGSTGLRRSDFTTVSLRARSTHTAKHGNGNSSVHRCRWWGCWSPWLPN